jgi:hypothetical protein
MPSTASGAGRTGRVCPAGLAVLLLIAAPAQAPAQVEIRSGAVQVSIIGYVQGQLNTTSVEDELEADLLVRRARLGVDLVVNDFVSGRVQPDFGEGEATLQDAYLRLTFHPAFRATVGQFKRAFDLFELVSSSEILVIERTGEVRGVDACTGPGGTCSFSRLTEQLQYAGRDIGVMLDGQVADGAFRYMVSVTNGPGLNTSDENGAKSLSGRVAVRPVRDVVVAGQVAAHDYLLPVAPDVADDEYAIAFGGDVELGNFERGVHFQGGVVAGDNWRNLVLGEPSTFLAAQGILTWKFPLRPNRFASHLEPVARVSWADPDLDLADDEGILATGGLVLHFLRRNKVSANVDFWSPLQGDAEWSLKVQSQLGF